MIDVDPETALGDHYFLGCTQRDTTPYLAVGNANQTLLAKITPNTGSYPEAGGGGEPNGFGLGCAMTC